MSEGEFKKRLFRELQKYSPDTEIHFELSAVGIWVDEAKKDIILTERDLYKQAVEWGNKGEMKVCAAFERAADAIRTKRIQWFGSEEKKGEKQK